MKMVQSRGRIFKKRSGSILKKAHELAVLCDIKVCAVIVGPNGEIETRPENPIEAIKLLKQLKDNKNTIFESANFIVNGAAEKKVVAQEAIKIKKLDFPFFDDKLVNGLSKESVLEIMKILKSKIEAARNRVELLKKTGKDQESRAGTGFEINPIPNFNEPIFNCSEMMFDFPPPQLNLPGLEYGLNIRFREECYFGSESQEQVGATDLKNNWNPNFDSEIVPNFPLPSQSNLPGFECGYGSSIRVPDCHFGSESALHLEQVIGLLQPSLEEVMLGCEASMASTPLQPLTQEVVMLGRGASMASTTLQPLTQEVMLGCGASMASTPLQPLTQQQLDWWFS